MNLNVYKITRFLGYSLSGLFTGFIAMTICASATAAETITGQVRTYVGQSLSPETPATAFTLESLTAVVFESKTVLSLLANVDRPTNRFENFEFPRLRARVKQGLGLTDAVKISSELSVNALDLHRWSDEGTMIRTSPGLVLEKRVFNDQLGITVKAAPFYQFNSFRLTTGGKVKPEYGVSELLSLEFKTGRTTLSADIAISQTFQGVWKNTYATTQEVAYNFTDAWSAGAGHELLGGFVDESTGRYSSLKFFDNRQSRVSAFLGYEF